MQAEAWESARKSGITQALESEDVGSARTSPEYLSDPGETSDSSELGSDHSMPLTRLLKDGRSMSKHQRSRAKPALAGF